MKVPERTFTTVHAEPDQRPLWVGLMGPSGGGKTFSALRLAKGIQSVIGGTIEFIDTESGRGKHYAEMFDYQYTAFPPPHGSLDYLAAIEHAVKVNKSKIVIIDSLSHEHEGEGGMIDWQEAEVTRMAGDDWKKREAVAMLAWTKPKQARKQLLRAMIAHGTDVVFILCFRADESSKPVKKDGKTSVVQMGFMPIAGKPFVYECTVCALLMPGANGVPTWNPENVGEKMMRKLPEQFKEMFSESEGKPMSEAHGVALAKWSLGGTKSPAVTQRATKSPRERVDLVIAAFVAADTPEKLWKAWQRSEGLRDELRDPLLLAEPQLFQELGDAYHEREDQLSARPPSDVPLRIGDILTDPRLTMKEDLLPKAETKPASAETTAPVIAEAGGETPNPPPAEKAQRGQPTKCKGPCGGKNKLTTAEKEFGLCSECRQAMTMKLREEHGTAPPAPEPFIAVPDNPPLPDADIARLREFASRAISVFLKDNDDNIIAANKALESLSGGQCKNFNVLPLFIRENPEFERVVEEAMS